MAAEWQVFAAEIIVPTGGWDFVVTEDPGGGSEAQFTATVAAGSYFLFGSGVGSNDLGVALATALDTASGSSGNGAAYGVTYQAKTTPDGATGLVTIEIDQLSFRVDGTDAGHTFDMGVLGFVDSTDYASTGLNLLSVLSPSHTWCSDQPAVRADPLGAPRQIAQHETPGGQRFTFRGGIRKERRRYEFRSVNDDRTWAKYSASDTARAFESFKDEIDDGRRVRVYRDSEASAGTLNVLSDADLEDTIIPDAITDFTAQRENAGGLARFRWSFDAQVYVAP
jgi:hypothetical protein